LYHLALLHKREPDGCATQGSSKAGKTLKQSAIFANIIMSPPDAEAKLAFLLEPATQALLAGLCADSRDDLALSQSPPLKGLSIDRRIALLEQRKLRFKALRKRPEAMDLIFTALGLEQMTHAELSRYKASRLPADLGSMVDLACGLGGDSFHVPSRIKLIGVDLSGAALMAYRHNVSRFRSAAIVRGDAAHCPVRADAALLDPSRRLAGKSERWQDEDMSPGWDVMERLISRYGNMAIKLGPGISPPPFLEEHGWEYLGLRDECLELVVWTGALGRPGLVRAVELPEGESIEAWRGDLPDTFGRVGDPGAYLFEPVKAVVRAHLFGVLAEKHGLRQIDPRIAYLTGDEPVDTALLKPYRVLRELPFDMKAIKEFLRREEVGRLEVKKRGLNLIPEQFRAGLKLAGENEGTLIFTRVGEKKTAFWTKAVRREAAGGPGAAF
jgi:hypothetical protein